MQKIENEMKKVFFLRNKLYLYDMKKIEEIFKLPFIKALELCNAKIYIVGGSIRDFLLGKEPKDIDLVVCNIPIEDLIYKLNIWGSTELVGQSFGVIKFKYDNIVYDIAIPRKDFLIKGEKGHKSIDAQSDHTLPIENDLERRDFSINAMCIGSDLKIIDPFGGQEDINEGIIDCVSKETFVDDPLRILRALQFAARFNFFLSEETEKLIKENKHLIKDISMERIFDELAKPFNSNGNIPYFAALLHETGIFEEIFGKELKVSRLDATTLLSEMLYFGIADTTFNVADFYKKHHKNINNDLFKELKSFNIIYDIPLENGRIIFHAMFDSMKFSYIVLKSNHIPDNWKEPFLTADFPCNRSEIAITGDELIKLGFKEGKEVGDKIDFMLDNILRRKVINNKESLLKLIGK